MTIFMTTDAAKKENVRSHQGAESYNFLFKEAHGLLHCWADTMMALGKRYINLPEVSEEYIFLKMP